jgi:glycosyltransferase 2 family protein
MGPSPSSIEPTTDTSTKNMHRSQHQSWWFLLFSLILAAILLYFTLRGLDWVAFWTTIKTGRYEILLITVPVACINYFIRALRWSIFVSSGKKVSVLPIFWANMVGYMGNTFLPARAGELLRSAFLGKNTGLGTSFVLATALAERVLDAGALVLIGTISLLWLGNVSSLVTNAVRVVALVGILFLAFLIIAPFQETLILRLFRMLPLPSRITQVISDQITRFLFGMRSLQNWRRMLLFLMFTIIIWFVDAVSTTFGVRIVFQSLNLGQALILLSALGLSSAIPSTPGYIGVYQFVAVAILVPFGFSRSEALTYILVSQVINYLLVGFWGLIGLWQINKSNIRAEKS